MAEYGVTNWRGRQVFTLATEANLEAMKKAAAIVERDVKTHFTVPGTGKSSRRTKTGKRHYASLPGQPPAVDTGVLRSSIIGQVSIEGVGVVGKVGPDIDYVAAHAAAGTDVEYGYYLELGTAKMAARPFLRPSLRRTAKKVKEIFVKANS